MPGFARGWGMLKFRFHRVITPLHETDKLSCEGKVSVEECLKALHEFKKRKVAGN